MTRITVFTPTYNRAYALPELFASLMSQNCDSFCWLIVDDGSTDGTEELVSDFKKSACFPIQYMKQENGGKQRAWNAAVGICETELFFCVDSDDCVAPQVLNQVMEVWEGVCEDDSCAGIIGLDANKNGEVLGTRMPKGVEFVTSLDLYNLHKFKGDTARVYRTDVLREFPFKVAEGEKFVTESSVFFRIDQRYRLKVLDEVLTIVEYRDDGYSKNSFDIIKNNPIGYYEHKAECVGYDRTLIQRFKDTILFLVGYHLAHGKSGISEAPNRGLAVLSYIPSIIVRKTIFR